MACCSTSSKVAVEANPELRRDAEVPEGRCPWSVHALSILVGVMAKFADALGKVGGSQVVFRTASARQDLGLDQRPQLPSVKEFAEYLQADAEELSLTLGTTSTASKTTTSTQDSGPTTSTTPAVKAMTQNSGKSGSGDRDRAKCRFWGTSQGCNRGDRCNFSHSWDGIDKAGRCFGCSGEGHMKKGCPANSRGDDAKKSAKTKPKSGGDTTTSTSTKVAATSAKKEKEPPVQKNQTETVKEPQKTSEAAASSKDESGLLSEASGLLKSLGNLKTVRVRSLDWESKLGDMDRGKFALLDGGATHALRQARQDEIGSLYPVVVELATGSTTLYRHPSHQTLLSMESVEPIIPLHALAERG